MIIRPELARAAAMLHVEAALAVPVERLAYVHIDRGQRILSSASGTAGPAAEEKLAQFTEKWHALAIVVYITFGDFARAQREIQRTRPGALDVRLLQGALYDLNARLAEPNRRGRANNDRRGVDGTASAEQTVLALERIVRAAPDFLDARLRLGWALLLNNSRSGRVHEQLDEVALRATRADQQYLVHLFLGALEMRDGHVEDAQRDYAVAYTAMPRQAALMALLQLDRALGRDAEAQALADAFSSDPARNEDDPWMRYNVGATSGELLDGLRDEARLR